MPERTQRETASKPRADAFELSKWYMDCVSDAGEVFIGYAASARLRGLGLQYASVLETGSLEIGNDTSSRARRARRPRTAIALRGVRKPELRGSNISWRSKPLGVTGRWAADLGAVRRRLLTSERGVVDWCCFQPRSLARIDRDRGGPISGLGYVEHLRLTIKPWQLPISELRWGRFLSPDHALVWIEWRGPHPLLMVIHNGRQTGAARVSDSAIKVEDRRGKGLGLGLKLDRGSVLREGRVGTTALSRTPVLNRLLPAKMLDVYECKWRSSGVLSRNGTTVAQGWAIHEVVRWN